MYLTVTEISVRILPKLLDITALKGLKITYAYNRTLNVLTANLIVNRLHIFLSPEFGCHTFLDS